ncbi:hypothetical protein EYZ11_007193 [Aspergillus tanneri]|uniref:Uncharacterized protein n=1 Tax=Aspergillus tanneri TaxID=1220188 RepID=A0A4S3JFV6_9EURO|nr:hypothetical protein EYZ11_007193 [Aspergillus tanneri]
MAKKPIYIHQGIEVTRDDRDSLF